MSDARDGKHRTQKNRGENLRESVHALIEMGAMHRDSENFSTAVEYYQRALDAGLSGYERFDVLLAMVDCYRLKSDLSVAQEFVDAARAALPADPEPVALGKLEYREAFLEYTRGSYDKALDIAFSGFRRLKGSDLHTDVGDVLMLLGVIYARLGNTRDAEEFYMDALGAFRRDENAIRVAYVYNNLGVLHKNACRWSRALAALAKSREIASEGGFSRHVALVDLNLATVHHRQHNFAEAIASAKLALDGSERLGEKLNVTRALLTLGRAYGAFGDHGKAERYLMRGHAAADDSSFGRERVLAEEFLGELLLAKRRFQDARVAFDHALAAARKMSPKGDVVAEILRRSATANFELGHTREAMAAVDEGFEIADTCGEVYELGYFLRERARCQAELGQVDRAADALEQSYRYFEKHELPGEQCRSMLMWAQLHVDSAIHEDLLKAKKVLDGCVQIADRQDDSRLLLDSYMSLARIEVALDNLDEAMLCVFEAERLSEELAADTASVDNLRAAIESRMTNATTRVADEFSALSEIRAGSASRENLIDGLNSTLALIAERVGVVGCFVAIPKSADSSTLEVVAISGMGKRAAKKLALWRRDQDEAMGVSIVTAPELLEDLDVDCASLHGLGFQNETLGVLGIIGARGSLLGKDTQSFVAAYATSISIAIYESARAAKLPRQSNDAKRFQSIVTDSPEMIRLLNLAERVAQSNATVLLQGETGTGKGLFAYAIHMLSERRDAKFIHVNCAALPEQLLESELFGHARGAFTGAHADKEGLLQEADGGTIFLDEIGKTSLVMQGKLLQFLDNSKVRRVGANDLVPVDVRVICASKGNLLEMAREGRFLEDFFYRINDFPLMVPPLRDRKEDIALLTGHYLDKFNAEMGKEIRGISDDFMARLLNYAWPGNVRELEKVIKRAVILADPRQELGLDHLAPEVMTEAPPVEETEDGLTLKERIERLEQLAILEALKRNEGNKSQTALQLGISYPNLLSKIKRYNIQ